VRQAELLDLADGPGREPVAADFLAREAGFLQDRDIEAGLGEVVRGGGSGRAGADNQYLHRSADDVAAQLGHLPFGATATGNTSVAITSADQNQRVYADNRQTQIDMRFAKVLRFGRTRTDVGVDLSNLLNTNYVTTYATVYDITPGANGGTWGNPTAIYPPRFVRLNFTVNF
jgi:hypothetical protein